MPKARLDKLGDRDLQCKDWRKLAQFPRGEHQADKAPGFRLGTPGERHNLGDGVDSEGKDQELSDRRRQSMFWQVFVS